MANVNKLRDLVKRGVISQADLTGETLSGSIGEPINQPSPSRNALRQFADGEGFGSSVLDALYDPVAGRFRSGGAVRDESTGKVSVFAGAEPQRQAARVVGVGGSGVTDLGMEQGGNYQVDMSRPPIEIAGLGKGYYTKDGRSAIIQNPDGTQTRALLGFDREATMRNKFNDLKMQKDEADINYRNLQAQELQRGMNAPASGGAMTMSEVLDPKDPSRLLRIDARTYRGGSLGDEGVIGISGKEPTAAKRDEKSLEGREQLASVLAGMRQNLAMLRESGGMVSNQESAPENLVARVRSSRPGQFLGGVFGTPEQTARKELDSSRLQLLSAIKNATGMSSQQMNSNMELKAWLDSLGATNSDYESNVAILDKLEDTFVKNAGAGKVARAGERNQSDERPKELSPAEWQRLQELKRKYGR